MRKIQESSNNPTKIRNAFQRITGNSVFNNKRVKDLELDILLMHKMKVFLDDKWNLGRIKNRMKKILELDNISKHNNNESLNITNHNVKSREEPSIIIYKTLENTLWKSLDLINLYLPSQSS